MAVKVKAKKSKKSISTGFFEKIFEGKFRHIIFIGLLFIILSISFFKIAFQNYAPPASDTMQWRTSAQVLMEYNKIHKEQALWNPNVFSGMPGYLTSFGSKYPFINTIIRVTNKVMNWRILLLFSMGLGVYLLMIYLKFDPLIAFISAVALALSCHFIGLMEIGHNSKFKALIYIPWIFYVMQYLKDRKSILAMGLAALLIIGQLRENHPQISYYTFLMLGIYWIFQLIWAIKEKEFKPFLIFTGMFLGVIIISFMAVAQPYFSTFEYGEYTIRGGAEGLETSYATSWSFHPLEILTFVNPSFFGGVSPYYWGWMPFTQTSMYLGVVIFLFALLAVFFNRSRMVKVLTAISIVALFISFGRHLPFLSNLLLNYLPGFNKFRVPAMILILVQFSFAVLAGYGLKTVLEKFKDNDTNFFELTKKVLIGVIILFILFIALSGTFESLGLSKAGEKADYNDTQMHRLKSLRAEKMFNDGIQTGIILILSLGLTLLLGRGKIGKYPFLLLIAVIVIIDLLLIDNRFLQEITPQSQIEKHYKKTLADDFLIKDKEIFRIYPLGREFGQNRWAYYHQTIGGYHGAKLKRYQEIIENCLNYEFQNRIPINWNIVNMLNTKYVIYSEKLPLENLEFAFYDRKQKQTIYKNTTYLPRAWFVENVELIPQKRDIWKQLNQQEFNPAHSAIVEKNIEEIYAPVQAEVNLIEFDLHKLKFSVSTDTTSFLTVSEIYYPAGWKAYLDGKETEIYATNYILRGVLIPKGEHVLEMKFESAVYALSLKFSLIGLIITVLLILVGLYLYIRKNYRGEIIYVVKK